MTKIEAKTKICLQDVTYGIKCKAAECMAWRWDSTHTKEDVFAIRQFGYSLREAIEYCQRNLTDMTQGHCGLAGKS